MAKASSGRLAAAFPVRGHNHEFCLADALAAAEAKCRAQGARFTKLRRQVFELVHASHQPTGAYEILEALAAERGRTAPPTVYRALDFLSRLGLVHRIESLNAFVGCSHPGHEGPHPFLICDNCGVAAEIDETALLGHLRSAAGRLGFAIESLNVEATGRCPNCALGA
ncbi:MAG: Fur family transcriptional regulator [Alphaproteobacteria bacterium]|nr:Fur family transcriptional regulator [Alphaproteobacteria bacterium]